MATLKVDTITSDTLPTVSITDGLSISGVTTSIGRLYSNDRITCTEIIDIDADNKALRIGDSQELQLTYTGSAAEIKNIDASSPITIKVKDGDETAAAFNANGTVDLYHNNVRTFATDSAGAIVYGPEGGEGHLYLFADEGDDNADKWRLNAHTNGNFYLQEKNTGSWVTKMYAQGGAGKVALMHNTTEMFETTSTGVKIPVATSGHGLTIDAASNNVYPQLTFNSNRSAEDNSIGYIRGQWNSTDVVAIDFMAGPDTTNKDDGAIKFSTRVSGSGIAERMRIKSDGEIVMGLQAGVAYDTDTLFVNGPSSSGKPTMEVHGNGNNSPSANSCALHIKQNCTSAPDTAPALKLTHTNTLASGEGAMLSMYTNIGDSTAERAYVFHTSGRVIHNRPNNDGTLISFRHDDTEEGSISISGSTVSYNGGHLSRWSQFVGLSTTSKADRPTIYQGTVLSNLDAMCEWPGEENQQLNKTKVSDTVGDKDVAGVFWTWDDDDDEYVNDFYVAMTGDMVIRVAGSTTVARGDLLESAGDGTAKPQSDDIVRSKTIAKIISTTSTATYADGSKAYPCVLMAC